MSFLVGDVSIRRVQEVVPAAFEALMQRANGEVWVDLAQAAIFWQEPGKHTEARSQATVRMGRFAATAWTLVFLPEQGTGDNSDRSLSSVASTAPYPRTEAAVPRDKGTVEREIEVPIASFSPNGRIVLGAGCLDLVGINLTTDSLVRLGSLGQTPDDYEAAMIAGAQLEPRATWTVWRYGSDTVFGGKHAVVNATGDLQVATFIAMPRGCPTDLLLAFKPELPAECAA